MDWSCSSSGKAYDLECLLCKSKALISNPSPTKTEKGKLAFLRKATHFKCLYFLKKKGFKMHSSVKLALSKPFYPLVVRVQLPMGHEIFKVLQKLLKPEKKEILAPNYKMKTAKWKLINN
jgi:hypothetical protein